MSNAADTAIQFALSQLGKPYVFGASGPNAYDCSGLTMAAYGKAGIVLPHSTYIQIKMGTAVKNPVDLRSGDLVFPNPGHVQLYIGNGKVVEAPDVGQNVQISSLWGTGSGQWTARRITEPAASAGQVVDNNAPFKPGTLKAPLTADQRAKVLAYIKPFVEKDAGKYGNATWDEYTKYTDGALLNLYTQFASQGTMQRKGDEGQVTAGITKDPMAAINALTNPLWDMVKAFQFLTDPKNWKRAGMILAGGVLILVALVKLTGADKAIASTAVKGMVAA